MFVIHASIRRKSCAHVRQSVKNRSGDFPFPIFNCSTFWLRMPFVIQTQYIHYAIHMLRNTYATQYISYAIHTQYIRYEILCITYSIKMQCIRCPFPNLLRNLWVQTESMFCVCSSYVEYPDKVYYGFVTNNECVVDPICEQCDKELRTPKIAYIEHSDSVCERVN